MELVYSNDQLLMVNHVRNLLESAYIKSELRNEFLGSGAGDLAPLDTWPELWVAFDDVEKAKAVISNMDNESALVWHCKGCDEENPAAFDICWQCEKPKI